MLDPVRAYVAGLQDPLNMATTDLFDDAALDCARHNLVERRRDPPLRFLRFACQRNQLQSRFLRNARRTATALTFSNALCALPCNALAPRADRLHRYTELSRNHGIRVSLMCPQRNSSPHHIPLRGRLLCDQRQEFLFFFLRQLH